MRPRVRTTRSGASCCEPRHPGAGRYPGTKPGPGAGPRDSWVATGFSVTLMGSGTRTQGVVLCDQTRTVDARARTYKKIEKAPEALVQEALDAVRAILE